MPELSEELDSFLAALARIFTYHGGNAEIAVLSYGVAKCEMTGYDNWDGGTNIYTITIEIPPMLYNQILNARDGIEANLASQSGQLMRRYHGSWLGGFIIMPQLIQNPLWRNDAIRWLKGETVSNQGRVRSDAIAPIQVDGLLFRSQPEVYLYQALKRQGIPFAPLPVFLRGGESYSRIEPDFLIFWRGKLMVLEIDGKQFHHESPVDAHTRLTILSREGAHIERISSSECDSMESATACAARIVSIFEKIHNNK